VGQVSALILLLSLSSRARKRLEQRKESTMTQQEKQPELGEDLQDLSEEQLVGIAGGAIAAKKTYTVVVGDSLSTIASKTYGYKAKWKELYQKNKDVIGNDPHFLHAGQKLTL